MVIQIPWSGNEAYGKNLKLQMGRCPVRSVFPQALEALKRNQHLLGSVILSLLSSQANIIRRFMADKIMPLSEAVEGYDLFDKMKAQKVIFEA